MDKLKIAGSFLKIKFHNIFSVIVKAATGYIVGSFATIQLSSIVVDNVSTQAIIGMPSETFMQYLFIALIVLFPVVLIIAFITKKKSLNADSLSNFDEINSTIDNQKPKIGVIPFENLNENSESGYLVDGIAEDLITELSMVNEISIATRKTSFSLRGKDYTSQSFKDEWGFDYIVSGSIRSSDERIRISVELSDMTDDRVVWSNKYDRVKADIFEIQDEIVTKIINSIIGNIEIASLKRANRKPTENMTSYEFMLMGRALNQKFDKEANKEAIKMLDAAIEADKTNPLPYSWKACTIGQAMFLGFRDQDEKTMSEFLGALSKANEMNDNDWNTNRILAEAHITMQDYPQAKVYATRAYKANPNNPHVMSAYGDALLRNDDVDTAIKVFKKMYSVEPIPASDTNEDRPKKALMFAYYLNNDFDKAIEMFNEIEEPDFRSWLICADIKAKQGLNYLKEKWFEEGLKTFKETDADAEISRFHLPNKEHKSQLVTFYKSVLS